jgi:hypothetical protein
LVGYQILNVESRFKFEAAFLFYKIFWACLPFLVGVPKRVRFFVAIRHRGAWQSFELIP